MFLLISCSSQRVGPTCIYFLHFQDVYPPISLFAVLERLTNIASVSSIPRKTPPPNPQVYIET